jgi:L-aspartate oxidase
MKYDVIIIGTGIAGLYAANLLSKTKSVLLLSKNRQNDCNTYWAQGGIATALSHEDIDAHIADTMSAGAGANNEEAVALLVKESLEVVPDLLKIGVPFDKDENGELHYTKEGAHSQKRIIHAGGDATGKWIHDSLRSSHEADIFDHTSVVDLLIKDNICYGVTALHHNSIEHIYADHVIIASGGLGSLYEYNTNATGISGDIHGMCHAHQLPLQDMHLLQFHPTVFVATSGKQKLLLTEALRGEGATIVDQTGRRFLFDIDERGELASRDIVARGIYEHAQNGNEVFLDVSHFDESFFLKRFPTVSKGLKEAGIAVPKEPIPISPAFHYAMGGIETDINARVSGMSNLFAIGEAASNRVHGANRLASNSLLEGLVFAKVSAHAILSTSQITPPRIFEFFKKPLFMPIDEEIKKNLAQLMWEYSGVIRTQRGLKHALDKVQDYIDTPCGWFVKLRLFTASAVLENALDAKTSIGAHYITTNEEK